jgi:hypothetical protein
MNKWMKRLGLGAAALALPLSTVALLGSGVAGASTVSVTFGTAHHLTITVNSGKTTGSAQLATLEPVLNCTGTAGATTYTTTNLWSTHTESLPVANFGGTGKAACIHIPIHKLTASAASAAKTITITGNSGTTATYITVTGAPSGCKIYTGSNLVIHNGLGLTTSFRTFTVAPTPTSLAFHISTACSTTPTISGITSIKISGSETAEV